MNTNGNKYESKGTVIAAIIIIVSIITALGVVYALIEVNTGLAVALGIVCIALGAALGVFAYCILEALGDQIEKQNEILDNIRNIELMMANRINKE